MYLSEDDFSKHFGVTKEDFDILPRWKQIQKKRASGIF